MAKCRVLIVDDHALLRSGLKALIDSQPDLTVVGEAGSGKDALRIVKDLTPDVIILDITLPDGSGIGRIEELRKLVPATRVLMITMHQDEAFLRSAFAAGAKGYLTKRAASAEVLTALRALFKGETFIDPSFPNGVLDEEISTRPPNQMVDLEEPRAPLSAREKEVLILFAQGCTNTEIAKRLKIGVRSAETYRSRIAVKLGFKHRTDFVRYALEMGLVRPGDNPT